MSLSAEELARLTQVRERTTMDGVPIVPDPTHFESSDPARNEAATIARWKDIVEAHGAIILGAHDIPIRPVMYDFEGFSWELHLMDTSGRRMHSVPETVHNRARALEAAGVPLKWWIWGDEQIPDVETFLQSQPGTPRRAAYTRHLERIEQGKRRALRTAPQQRRKITRSVYPDPLLIGVIPTATRPVWRGVWVLVGQWFD